jgi:hypothetical protein
MGLCDHARAGDASAAEQDSAEDDGMIAAACRPLLLPRSSAARRRPATAPRDIITSFGCGVIGRSIDHYSKMVAAQAVVAASFRLIAFFWPGTPRRIFHYALNILHCKPPALPSLSDRHAAARVPTSSKLRVDLTETRQRSPV